jgi:hypothetical protein
MKTMSFKPTAIPRSAIVAISVLVLFVGCSDEPVNMSRSSSNSQAVSGESNDESLTRAGMKRTFNAQLTGEQERPNPVDTQGSGVAIFKLSKDGSSLHYKVIVNNIKNITQAHIHCGGPEDAGPVVAFLFGFVAGGVTVNGVLAEGDLSAANVIPRPDSPACMGGLADFETLISKIREGNAYINVHTTAFPAGEIRGIIK